ncbi:MULTISPECIES: DNA-binding protein [Bacillus]|uniref:DNA-binding protein n=1 Tax=Bacillus TaxID=1386 RepID=UPI0018822200|nr:DNA-binding protein [Bacillus altitudinis]MCI9886045.1 DNA-binding protein [Bacillus altitudinis]MDM5165911.1 DNA-binding protein [Bacillus altitudinis]QOV50439.1 DNA-binding protein [Bacillus altitudinis]
MLMDKIGRLFSVDKVADLLSVESQIGCKLGSEGELRTLKLAGTTIRISHEELEQFLLKAFYWREQLLS